MTNYSRYQSLFEKALTDSSLQPSVFRVLMYCLAENARGTTEVSLTEVAERLGLCLRTTYRAVWELEKRHYIRRVKRGRRPPLIIVQCPDGQENDPDDAGDSKSDVQENQQLKGLQKLRGRIHTKEQVNNLYKAALTKIAAVIPKLVIPQKSYLFFQARLIHQTAWMLRLNYAKVILAIILADYYKTLNPDYQIRYAGGWIAKMATLPPNAIRIPERFDMFLEAWLSSHREERPPIPDRAPSRFDPDAEQPTMPDVPSRGVLLMPSFFCPRCGRQIADDDLAVADHERSCPRGVGSLGDRCHKCGKFVPDDPYVRRTHETIWCKGARR